MLHRLEKDLHLLGFDAFYRAALHLEQQDFRYTMSAPSRSDMGAIIIGLNHNRLTKAGLVAVTIGSTLLDSVNDEPRPAIAIMHNHSETLQVKFKAEPLFDPPLQIGALVVAKSQVPDAKNLWDVIAMDLRPEEEVDLEAEVDVNTGKLKTFLETVRGRSYSFTKEGRPRHNQGDPGIELLERELLLTDTNLRLK